MCVPLPFFPFLYASSAVRAQQAGGMGVQPALLLVQGPRSLSDGVFTLEWKIGGAVRVVCYSPNSSGKGLQISIFWLSCNPTSVTFEKRAAGVAKLIGRTQIRLTFNLVNPADLSPAM
ncbi:hypothetical protein WH47_04084 [Habropoda laboriosa]|uniref:Uncharacterized protein n=1 Tax=Habropoda laboriosa TaxID=597456 RepID=A0A0L7QJQ3_9HYME|nr:hypothetical protein WH47_04084 [Habropoda laboriosa]